MDRIHLVGIQMLPDMKICVLFDTSDIAHDMQSIVPEWNIPQTPLSTHDS